MKTLIAAGLAASALAATTAASARPVYPISLHHPAYHRVVATRGPVIWRGAYYRPGFHRVVYYSPGYYGVFYRAPYRAWGWGHVPVYHYHYHHHPIAWRGDWAGEHRPA